MRRAAKVDKNQAELVKAWRELGGEVLHLHMLGEGAPDLLMGMAGDIELVEVKSEDGALNQRQIEWRRWWRGRPPRLIRTVEELVKLAEEMKTKEPKRNFRLFPSA
jgi:hypothetical protein